MSDNLQVLLLVMSKLLLVSITSASPLLDFHNVLQHKSSVSPETSEVQRDGDKSDWPSVGTRRKRSFQTDVSTLDPSSNMQLDKRWKMSAWGKRDTPLERKRWQRMSAWGKRDEPYIAKKWQMSAWGKRDGGASDKRWQMSAWGKRSVPEKKWKQMSAWGKRDDIDPHKRWQTMSAWGKRSEQALDKRWQMSAWGKRSIPEKRWKQMSAWGKRDADFDLEQNQRNMNPSIEESNDRDLRKVYPIEASALNPYSTEFRDFDVGSKEFTQSDDNQSVNKRGSGWRKAQKKKFSQKDWGKRPSWTRTGFDSWGKRSTNSIDLRKLKAALLRLKPTSDRSSLQD